MEAAALAGAKRPREEAIEEHKGVTPADTEASASAMPLSGGGEPVAKKAKGPDELMSGGPAGVSAEGEHTNASGDQAVAEPTAASASAPEASKAPPTAGAEAAEEPAVQAKEAGAAEAVEEPLAVGAEGGEGPLIEAANEGDAEMSAIAEGSPAAGDATGAEGQDEPKDAPVKIGYRTFSSGRDAMDYFHGLIQHLTKNQDLNEYEQDMVLELIKMGHETPDHKLGEAGVRAVQVREHQKFNEVTSCFFLLRNDGSVDDVSARKCVARVFPSWGAAHSGKFSGPKGADRGRGRGASPYGGRDSGRGGSRGRSGFRGRDGGGRGGGRGDRGRGDRGRGRGGGRRGGRGGRSRGGPRQGGRGRGPKKGEAGGGSAMAAAAPT